jgi:hypothetical protein
MIDSTPQEVIRSISATGIDGTTSYAATITNLGSSVSLTGAGLGQSLKGISSAPDTGPGSNAEMRPSVLGLLSSKV